MPHKAQLLLQLAQAAAKVETRQQGVLPSVAVNVWDTLTGSHVATTQQQQQQQQPGGAGSKAASSFNITDQHRAAAGAGLGFLHLGHAGQHTGCSHAQQLLAQQAAAFHPWGMHPALPAGMFAADTAMLHDNSSWGPVHHQQQHGVPGPLLHAAAFPGRTLPAGAGLGPASRSAAGGIRHANPAAAAAAAAAVSAPPLLGGARRGRFNSSISLNKQIMNTHSARDLHSIVRSKGSMFDFFNISSAIARVPKLVGTSGGVQVGLFVLLNGCSSSVHTVMWQLAWH